MSTDFMAYVHVTDDHDGHERFPTPDPERNPFRTVPFSPAKMGKLPLPYLDVMSIQSKHLLPVSRKQLDANRPQLLGHRVDVDPSVDEDAVLRAHVDLDELLRSVRLLVEPLTIPDLCHTGVACQFGVREPDGTAALHVTAPNHTYDELQVKLFYPTGAKNANIREYIKETIHKHMGSLTEASSSPPKEQLLESKSAPQLVTQDESTSPKKPVKKKNKAKAKGSAYYSPAKGASPQKKIDVMASAARLSGSVSTSGLLNPELTRQAKEILSQLRANTNKVHDLIGS